MFLEMRPQNRVHPDGKHEDKSKKQAADNKGGKK